MSFCFLYTLFRLRKYLFDFSPYSYHFAFALNAVFELCLILSILKSSSILLIAAFDNCIISSLLFVSFISLALIFSACMSFISDSRSSISFRVSFLFLPTRSEITDLIVTFMYSSLLCGSQSSGICFSKSVISVIANLRLVGSSSMLVLIFVRPGPMVISSFICIST